MAEAVAVRRPLWHGVQPIAGLWFAHDTLGDDARVARLVAEWQPGSRALRYADGDVLLFAQPRLRRCDDCPGLPLRAVGRALASAPLAADEVERMAGADIGIVAGARLVAQRVVDGEPIDLARHIDLDAYALHDTCDFAETAPLPASGRLAGKNARDALGGKIPPASAERDAMLDALALRASGGRQRGGLRDAIGGVVGRAAGGTALALGTIRRLFARHAVPKPGEVGPRAPAPPRAPWRDALARLAMLTRASALIGRRQARHLARLLRLFDDGNIDEALRHALPLAGEGQANDLGPSFGSGLPRRDSLRLSARGGAGSARIGVGEALMEHLRKLYRRAFERLDRAGRIDEAAFVLGELLGSKTEALDYLVRHGRMAQAAELALGWDLPAATIVRLMLLAGDAPRAVQVARRDDAFAAAVAQLEPAHADLARTLRLEWGRALVAQGDWLGAVDAVWPLADARELAAAWLLAAETAGQELSARALVRRAILLPETLDEHAERVETLAGPGGSATARTALAQALLDHRQQGDGARRLAAAMLPAIAGDRAAGLNAFNRDALERLAKLAGDAMLAADLPVWQLPAIHGGGPLLQRSIPLHLPLPAAGLHRVYDAVRVNDNRWLVALGESGVAEIDVSGQIVRRFATPATRLVIATSRNVALAVSSLYGRWQISRLDLVRRSVVDLGTMPLEQFGETFDGIGWTAVSEDRVLVLDTTTPAREVLWSVELPGKIVGCSITRTDETYYLRTSSGIERWSYELPSRSLRKRTLLSADEFDVHLLDPNDGIFEHDISYDRDQRPVLEYAWMSSRHSIAFDVEPGSLCASMSCFRTCLVVAFEHQSMHRYFVIALGGSIVATFDWLAVPMPRVREDDGHLVFNDTHGRLLDIDLATSLCRTVSVI